MTKGLKIIPDQAVGGLLEVGKAMGLSGTVKAIANNCKQITFDTGVVIRVYSSAKGTTIDSSVGKDPQTGKRIVDEFLGTYGVDKVRPGIAVYKVQDADMPTFESDLITAVGSMGLAVASQSDRPPTRFLYKLTDANSGTLVVTLFDSGKLLVQGRTSPAWDDLCGWIELRLNASAEDVTLRFASQVKVVDVITSDDLAAATKRAEDELEDAFGFLYDHDRHFMISAIYLSDLKLELPEYSGVLMPAVKALEGYLKKCLCHCGVTSMGQIGSRNFNWGGYFNPNQHCLLPGKCKDSDKAAALGQIYKVLQVNRIPNFHSGPAPVLEIKTQGDAVSRIYQITSVMRSTYPIISK